MNAIVSLCHFCEAHGPRPVFCTFTTDDEKHTTEASPCPVQCNGCTSLGPDTVLVSRDDQTIYCSRECVPNSETTAFLRQAAIRSITCEVNWSKEGGVVYFNDTRGHVLSFMFQLCDTRARGLKRWFSIVVLMKDKMLLLNLTPLLSEHMQKISTEFQKLADVIFEEEQKICSQRALRLKTGRNDFGQSRSLKQLTGDEDVFKRLHSQFTWMLKAGAHTYSESLHTSRQLIEKLQPNATDNTVFDDNACSVLSREDCISLRALQTLVSKSIFRILMYCVLTGTYITIKSRNTNPEVIIKGLSRLLPIDSQKIPDLRIYNAGKDGATTANTCMLDETDNNNFSCAWPGVIPAKCPTIMSRIENAMNNDKFNDAVLHQHIKCLQMEWLGSAKTVKSAMESSGATSTAVVKLKQVLGICHCDEQLLNFWMNSFCK